MEYYTKFTAGTVFEIFWTQIVDCLLRAETEVLYQICETFAGHGVRGE